MAKIRKEGAPTLYPMGGARGRNEMEPLFCIPMENHFHHQSAICWHGGAGQLVLWIRPPQSRDRLLPNTRVSPSPLASCQFISVNLSSLPLLCLMNGCWMCIFPLPHVLWSYESGKHNTDIKYIIKTISWYVTHTARIMTFPPKNEWNICQKTCVALYFK